MAKKPQFTLITACNSDYVLAALNLIGSIRRNSDIFDRIVVYDLGIKPWQKTFFKGLDGVELRPVKPFIPHYLQCWSWKLWVWDNTDSDYIFYLDAGVEVLRDLSEIYESIKKDDYFIVSQNEKGGGHKLADIIPEDYLEVFGLKKTVLQKEVAGANIVGFKKTSKVYKSVVKPGIELVKQGYNLGWSKNELYRNSGIHYLKNPPVRSCPIFRHDQTVFNILLYKTLPHPVLHPLDKYANFKSPFDHPQQLIWNQRRASRLPFIRYLKYDSRSFLKQLLLQVLRLKKIGLKKRPDGYA